LGNETVLETGLTLHHTYGVPVIPGSAVKGLCRRAARKANVAAEPMKALFGDTTSAGYCCFHDAWYVPGSGGGEPLFVDVITPHHPNYQTGRERQWPTDFDDPNPVHHLAVKPGVRFRFVVDIGPMRELEAAKALVSGILRYAISEEGVGGKTSSGYGFFQADKAPRAANGAGAAETVVYRGADIFVQPRNEFKVRLSDRKTMIGPCQAPGLDIKKDQKGVNVTIKVDGRMKTIIKVEPAGS
jgi:CRISPR-associated protein Cmr6